MRQEFSGPNAGNVVIQGFRTRSASLSSLMVQLHERWHCRGPKVVQEKEGRVAEVP